MLFSAEVKKGQWCLLTGILQSSCQPRDATVYFDGPDGGIDILVSSVAIVPATTALRSGNVENQADLGQMVDWKKLSGETDGRPVHKVSNLATLSSAPATIQFHTMGIIMHQCKFYCVTGSYFLHHSV